MTPEGSRFFSGEIRFSAGVRRGVFDPSEEGGGKTPTSAFASVLFPASLRGVKAVCPRVPGVVPCILLATLVAVGLPAPYLGAATLLVEDGRARAEIVIAEQPQRSVRLAAQELQDYIR